MLQLVQKTEQKEGLQMEFNYNKLRGKIKEVYGTQDSFAEALGIGRVSLSQRLNNSADFSNLEIFSACRLLGISQLEIAEYFFNPKVQKSELVNGDKEAS
jgi:transcriptional regulator with XRE-family HTH domain